MVGATTIMQVLVLVKWWFYNGGDAPFTGIFIPEESFDVLQEINPGTVDIAGL
jgi:hypothetical protein